MNSFHGAQYALCMQERVQQALVELTNSLKSSPLLGLPAPLLKGPSQNLNAVHAKEHVGDAQDCPLSVWLLVDADDSQLRPQGQGPSPAPHANESLFQSLVQCWQHRTLALVQVRLEDMALTFLTLEVMQARAWHVHLNCARK